MPLMNGGVFLHTGGATQVCAAMCRRRIFTTKAPPRQGIPALHRQDIAKDPMHVTAYHAPLRQS